MHLPKWLSAYNSLMIPSDLQMEVQTPKHGIQNTVLLTLNSALSQDGKLYLSIWVVHSVQFSSVAQSCPTPRDPMNHNMPGIPVHHQLLEPTKPMSIELVMPSNHLILCHPLLLLLSIFPSIRVFSNKSTLHIRWPKYQSFIFSSSPSNEHPGLISFRMDWLDLLAVQGTLKNLL